MLVASSGERDCGGACSPPSVRRGMWMACSVYEGVLDRVERLGFDVLRHCATLLAVGARGRRGDGAARERMTRRATLRGPES